MAVNISTVLSFLQNVHTSPLSEYLPLRLNHQTVTVMLDDEVLTIHCGGREYLTQIEVLAIRESLALDLEQHYASDAGHLIRFMTNLSDVFTFWKELREEVVRQQAA